MRESRGKGGINARPAAVDIYAKAQPAQPIVLWAQPESDLFFHRAHQCAGLTTLKVLCE